MKYYLYILLQNYKKNIFLILIVTFLFKEKYAEILILRIFIFIRYL